jgi:hypothetical protein
MASPSPTAFNSWLELYNYKRFAPGNLKTIEEKEISLFDLMTRGYLQKPERFAVNVGSHASNFILLSTTQLSVNILHHAFAMSQLPEDPPKVFGIPGSQRFLLFKQVYLLLSVTAPMIPPIFVTRRDKSTIPTIKQFLELSEPDDLENLKGDNGEPLSEIGLLPNLHWIHPAIFTVLKGAKIIKAAKAAMIIINVLKAEAEAKGRDKNGPESEMAQSTQGLLVFLWAVT